MFFFFSLKLVKLIVLWNIWQLTQPGRCFSNKGHVMSQKQKIVAMWNFNYLDICRKSFLTKSKKSDWVTKTVLSTILSLPYVSMFSHTDHSPTPHRLLIYLDSNLTFRDSMKIYDPLTDADFSAEKPLALTHTFTNTLLFLKMKSMITSIS